MGKWRYKKKSKLFLFRKREKPISILLGAGFSAPMGYPIGNQLNEIIFNCHSDSISFHSDGTLVVGDNSNAHLIQYNQYYDFCKDIIRYYNDNIKAFDYEEFYDYLKGKAKDDSGLKELFEKGSYNKSEFDDFEQYVYQIDNIYNQLVAFYLKDREGRSWYDDEPVCSKPTFNGYTGFLNCIEELSKNCIINVHTLNHDLFFERLDNTEWINGKLGDGFKDENSTLYGGLDDGTKIKLPVYTGKYDAKIRLYKLHGSIDQYVFYARQRQAVWVLPETYIKSKPEIAPYDFYKEVTDAEGKVTYENCGTNYHPDFLTGVTYKVSRY
ncbi:MAG: hypothetical protein VB048_08100, partial [Bacteroidaceae bacterium]|nr:hypothetical protein [Bacteroidaceae bacterium]